MCVRKRAHLIRNGVLRLSQDIVDSGQRNDCLIAGYQLQATRLARPLARSAKEGLPTGGGQPSYCLSKSFRLLFGHGNHMHYGHYLVYRKRSRNQKT